MTPQVQAAPAWEVDRLLRFMPDSEIPLQRVTLCRVSWQCSCCCSAEDKYMICHYYMSVKMLSISRITKCLYSRVLVRKLIAIIKSSRRWFLLKAINRCSTFLPYCAPISTSPNPSVVLAFPSSPLPKTQPNLLRPINCVRG
jgi:hypothetical protein